MTAAILTLEDGRTFHGEAYGAIGETVGEAVFSTGMTGYQETLTDPSYHRQVVVMTAPHVGNTGVNDRRPRVRAASGSLGYVVRDPATAPVEQLARPPGRWTDELLRPGRRRHQRHRHPRAHPAPARARCHAGRDLQRRARVCRSRTTLLTDRVLEQPSDARRRTWPSEVEHDRAVRRGPRGREAVHRGRARPRHQVDDATFRMAEHGIEVHVLPASPTLRRDRARTLRTGSSSPTAPATRRPPTRPGGGAARGARRRSIPFFGICFGNQLLGRALGFGTYKLGYGHRGINQPVMDLTTGKVEVTAHNHGFAVGRPTRPGHRQRDGRAGTANWAEPVACRASNLSQRGRTAGPAKLRDEVGEPGGAFECVRVPTSAQRGVPPATATTTWSRGSRCWFDRFSGSSTTRRPRPGRTTRAISSTVRFDDGALLPLSSLSEAFGSTEGHLNRIR